MLTGLTRLGEPPVTVRQLAAALDRPGEEAIELAWKAARVRPENGRTRMETIWPGASPRRKLHVDGIPAAAPSRCGDMVRRPFAERARDMWRPRVLANTA